VDSANKSASADAIAAAGQGTVLRYGRLGGGGSMVPYFTVIVGIAMMALAYAGF
jgi:hypothetical protein